MVRAQLKRSAVFGLAVLLCLANRGYQLAGEEEKAAKPAITFKDQAAQITTTQPPIDQRIIEGLAKPYGAIAKDMQIKTFLEIIQQKTNLNIVATKEVGGSVTFLLDKVTIGDALEIALITNNLAKEIKGNIVHIMTEAQYNALYNEAYNSRRVIKTFQMQNISPKKMQTFIDGLTDKKAKIIPDDGTGTLVVMDVPERMQQIEEAIKKLDISIETRVFELKNAKEGDILNTVSAAVTKDYGSVTSDARMHRLIVSDSPRNMENIANLIRALDAKPRQVLIETKMIQVTLSNEFAMGINWQQVFSQFSKWENVKFVGTFPMSTKLVKNTQLETKIGTIPSTHYEMTIKALEAYGTNKIISAPRIIAMQDKPARFMVGTKEAYVTVTVTQTTASTTTAEKVEFVDVGVMLDVTPSINEDGFVVMQIKPEISSVTNQVTTSQGNIIPIVEKATTETSVMVKDGVTIVIAGLIKDDKQSRKSGIPILSSIPIIGPIFGATTETTVKTETVVFMTPYIISGDVDTSILSEKERLEEFMEKKLKELKTIR